MKTEKIRAAAIALAALGLSLPAFADGDGGTVDYVCRNGKSVSVKYKFNSAGIPTKAKVRLDGKKRELRYDMNRSDNVDTFMQGGGYILGTSAMDSRNYRRQSINITAPDGEMLYKGCDPRNSRRDKKHRNRQHDRDYDDGYDEDYGSRSKGSVRYTCQNGRRLDAAYRFNSAGVPTEVSFKADGRRITLPYDMNVSDNVETLFSGRGYRFGAEYIDSRNYRRRSISTVTDPDGRILYKGCNPR